MPSGKTHDAITILLAVPAAAAAYSVSGKFSISMITAVTFLFGGLMFGPDLDTRSKQYARWWIFRFLWFPYRSFFRHRSRWSHGLLFGTLFRVIYFLGVLSLAAYLILFCIDLYRGGAIPEVSTILNIWREAGNLSGSSSGSEPLAASFLGMWLGAASHTFTDMAGTYITTGRITEFL